MKAPPSAIVCDVGHVIYTGSALNFILRRLGRSDTARLLYDMKVLEGATPEATEAWVTEVIGEKIQALAGRTLESIAAIAREIPITPGFPELLRAAAERGVPVALVGAVPSSITEASVAHIGGVVDRVVGTSVLVNDRREITGVGEVCTPQTKARRASAWWQEKGIDRERCVVIGDSVGDLPTMALVPVEGRVGFNATHAAVRDFVAVTLEKEMFSLIERLF